MYWTHSSGIDSSTSKGANQETIFSVKPADSGITEPRNVTVDTAKGKVYWTKTLTSGELTTENSLWSANLDGTDAQEVLGKYVFQTFLILPGLFPFAIDVVGDKMYWVTFLGVSKIMRLNLNGFGIPEEVATINGIVSAMTIDAVERKVYWVVEGLDLTTKIQRANLDVIFGFPNVPEDVVIIDTETPPLVIAVDSGVSGRIYWIGQDDNGAAIIRYANLADKNQGDLVKLGFGYATSLALDTNGGKIYWMVEGFDPNAFEYSAQIRRANLDGTGAPENIIGNLGESHRSGLATDQAGGRIYWTISTLAGGIAQFSGKIEWASISTGIPKEIRRTDSFPPKGIAIDTRDDKIYWTNPGKGTIQQANPNGTDMLDLITGLNLPEDVIIDPTDDKIYWTEGPRQNDVSGEDIDVWSIRRADIDGANREVFYYSDSWYGEIRGLAIDQDNKTVYWTDGLSIESMKTDKSQAIPNKVVQGASIFDVAIDTVNQHLYWTESIGGFIRRSNLDGSRKRIVVTGVINPHGLAVDPISEKIYWTAGEDGKTGKVQWANFDGTNIDDVIQKTSPSPKYIVLAAKKVKVVGIYPTGDVSGDFKVDAFDAALILQFSIGMIDVFPVDELIGMSPEDSIPSHYEVSVPKLTTFSGKRIYVPIAINGAKGLLAGGITLKYDATVLKAERTYPGLNGTYWKTNTDTDGEVRMAFVSLEEATENDMLFVVEFDVLSNAEGKESPIILDYVELSNSLSVHKRDGMITVLPGKSRLLQNYPNPFNPETWIPYQLSTDADVIISVYDVGGRMIHQLELSNQPAGSYLTKDKAAYWDGRNSAGEMVSSGVYFYVLKAGDFSAKRRMLILK